jgi:hypothetical protein
MKRMRFVMVIALAIAAGLTGILLHPAQAAGEPVKIILDAENASGETGTATLTDLGNGKTMVDVAIAGEPDGASQPMHIHEGQCGPTLGKVIFPLTNLEKGKSSTTIDAALDTLMTGGFAINGHKSAQEITVYVFCGNIPESDAMMMAHETATDEAMAMAHATATTEAMMMAEATATDQAMAMAHATATTEAMMMAEATATDQAMAMAHATATTEAMMMAQATSTQEAIAAEATATPAAATAAENATPTASAEATIPTTGGSDGSNWLLVLTVFGLVALGAGIALRQTTRKT